MAHRDSEVLRALAARYARTTAGRTGRAARDLLVDYENLLAAAQCAGGEPRVCAERDLQEAERAGLVKIERHSRSGLPLQVRFSPAQAGSLFGAIGECPPDAARERFANLFASAAQSEVSAPWDEAWRAFCDSLATAARAGGDVRPFNRTDPEGAAEVLAVLPKLLAWRGESLVRFASCVLCRDSKRLEQLRARAESCLARITRGKISSLADMGIVENERSLLLHGPLRLCDAQRVLEADWFSGAIRIGAGDIARATLESSAARCLTVENPSMLHELAKLRSGVLLIGSGSEGGYAHSATLRLLAKLPETIEYWHFGDSDPAGFDILRDLRERTGRSIQSMHMQFRDEPGSPSLTAAELQTIHRLVSSPLLTEAEKRVLSRMREANRKGRFEQESLGLPQPGWPFYDAGD